MDITDALAPASDQLDAVELVDPRTFTIDTGSRLGKRDGKTVAEIRLVGFDRVWRPSKGMLDVLAACWGTDGAKWAGHRVTVYNDRSVTFGPEKTGGIRISHLSHIDKARDVTIRANGAGRTKLWHVEPLTEPARHDTLTGDQAANLGRLMVELGLSKAEMLTEACTFTGRSLASASEMTVSEGDGFAAYLATLLPADQPLIPPAVS